MTLEATVLGQPGDTRLHRIRAGHDRVLTTRSLVGTGFLGMQGGACYATAYRS